MPSQSCLWIDDRAFGRQNLRLLQDKEPLSRRDVGDVEAEPDGIAGIDEAALEADAVVGLGEIGKRGELVGPEYSRAEYLHLIERQPVEINARLAVAFLKLEIETGPRTTAAIGDDGGDGQSKKVATVVCARLLPGFAVNLLSAYDEQRRLDAVETFGNDDRILGRPLPRDGRYPETTEFIAEDKARSRPLAGTHRRPDQDRCNDGDNERMAEQHSATLR